jgi:hypothetical protein
MAAVCVLRAGTQTRNSFMAICPRLRGFGSRFASSPVSLSLVPVFSFSFFQKKKSPPSFLPFKQKPFAFFSSFCFSFSFLSYKNLLVFFFLFLLFFPFLFFFLFSVLLKNFFFSHTKEKAWDLEKFLAPDGCSSLVSAPQLPWVYFAGDCLDHDLLISSVIHG